MNWFILFIFILFIVILFLIILLFLFNQKENFTVLNSTPIIIAETNPIYKTMLTYTKNKNDKATVEEDLRYFNNASHILFGLQRIPT